MARLQNKQAGFNIVELLIVIAIVGVLGSTGWFVYQHNRPKTADASRNNQIANNQPTNTTLAPTVSYLDIKEWGVKLPLSNANKDAYYVVATNSTDTMWLGLTSLDSAGCAANLGNTQGASAVLAAIVRVLPTDLDPVKGMPYSKLYPGVTINGSYYAYISHPNNHCTSGTVHQAIDTAFTAGAKAAVPATATAN